MQTTIKIRMLTENDGDILYRLIESSRHQLKNLVWSKDATLESTIQFLKQKLSSLDLVHGVFLNNNLVGVLELRNKFDKLELGYWVGAAYRGQGLMKIAVKQLVDKEVQYNTIIAHIREANQASLHILQYAGLSYDHTEVWENEP